MSATATPDAPAAAGSCTIAAADLDRWTKPARQVAGGVQGIDALRGVRLSPGRVEATNLFTTLAIEAPGLDVDALISADALAGVLGSLDAREEVTLEVDGGELVARQGRMELRAQLMGAKDYPELPAPLDGPPELVLEGEAAAALATVAGFASSDETRPLFEHVQVRWNATMARLVANDTYRLGWWEGEHDGASGASGWVEALVHTKGLRLLPKGDGPLVIVADSNRVTLRRGGVSVTMPQVSGDYPDTERLFPDCGDNTARIADESLDDLRRMLGAVGKGDKTPARLTFTGGDDTLLVAVRDPDQRLERELAVTLSHPWPGESMEVGANARFLSGVLGAVGSGDIAVLSPLRPLVFGVEPGEYGMRALLMPIRLN